MSDDMNPPVTGNDRPAPPPPPPPPPPPAKVLYGRGTLLAIGAVVLIYAGITLLKQLNPDRRQDRTAAVPAQVPAPEPAPAAPAPVELPWTTPEAVVFDGISAYSSVGPGPGNDALLDGRHPVTVSFWLKRGQFRGDALFIKGADPQMCLAHFDAAKPQQLHFYFKRGGDAASIRVYADGFTEVGEWVHLCVAYDGSGKAGGVSIYKNGAPQQVVTINDGLDGPVENPGPVILGAYRAGEKLEWFFSGKLAEFHVLDRLLSAEDVPILAKFTPSEN
ncbi:MAG TPA: hypothetical protein DDW67_09385 [Elusimicrobia bacterium]|nr:hypothetical protein [Elusimicrobiota bacterium]